MSVRRNLPPEAEQWGRDVDKQLSTLSQTVRSNSLDTDNALKGVTATLGAVSKQIEALQSVTEQLVVVTDTLATQQSQLQTAFNQIEALALNQVTGATATASTPQAEDIVAGKTYAVASVTVPSGYTRAVVSAVTTLTASGTSGQLLMSGRTVISGKVGVTVPFYAASTTSWITHGGTSHAASFTGLQAGGTITAGFQVVDELDTNALFALNTMTVIFLK